MSNTDIFGYCGVNGQETKKCRWEEEIKTTQTYCLYKCAHPLNLSKLNNNAW